jgi:hypothetical protein
MPIAHGVASHIAGCDQCRDEVRSIQRSLEFVEEAPELEPGDSLSTDILLAARNERVVIQQRRRRHPVTRVVRGLACAAGIAIVASISFRAALDTNPVAAEPVQPAQVVAQTLDSGPSPEEIRQAGADVERLAAAVQARREMPDSLQTRQQARAAAMFEADMRAAQAAYARNPGHERASRLMQMTLERRTEALKSLYLSQSL